MRTKKSGNKIDLFKQSKKVIENKLPKFTEEQLKGRKGTRKPAAETTKETGLKAFPPNAYWKPLTPNNANVADPNNPSFLNARAR